MTLTSSLLLSSFLSLSVDAQAVLVLLAIFLLAYNLIQWATCPCRANLPPGPRGIPILGVLPFLGKKPYLTIQRWWRQYGDVYSMYMGSRLVVVLNGIDVMRECFVKKGDSFLGRPWNYFKKLTGNTGEWKPRLPAGTLRLYFELLIIILVSLFKKKNLCTQLQVIKRWHHTPNGFFPWYGNTTENTFFTILKKIKRSVFCISGMNCTVQHERLDL